MNSEQINSSTSFAQSRSGLVVQAIYTTLQKMLGHHRQLLEAVREERKALVDADIKRIQEMTYSKEATIESIRLLESQRIKLSAELAVLWKRPLQELTLSQIILSVQGEDIKMSENLRNTYNALLHIIGRARDQNRDNSELVQKSLEHVTAMKKNILGESVPWSQTYNPQGQPAHNGGASRLISQEA